MLRIVLPVALAGAITWAGSLAPAHSQPEPAAVACCLCTIAYPPGGGDPIIGCNCEANMGGLACTITQEGCRTVGTCTPGK